MELSAEEVYPGEAIVFDGSSSFDPDGTIVAFFWDFGDGHQGSGEVAVHAYATPGPYTVTLTVTDDRGATDTAQATVTVLAPPEEAPPPEPGTLVRRFSFQPEAPEAGKEATFDALASSDPDEDGEGAVVRSDAEEVGVYEVTYWSRALRAMVSGKGRR